MLFIKEFQKLLELNEFIQGHTPQFDYHMKHITLVKEYGEILNKRLGFHLDVRKLGFAALSHDLFKERGLIGESKTWHGYTIPQNNPKYVRTNLDILESLDLDDYFNTDIQYHPLAAGIFLYKELGIRDPEILYPVVFHSCPIIDVYSSLPLRIQNMVDIIMLADKLSSNYLRINMKENEVKIDLDQAVFGPNGNELNYTMGLYIARLISQGKSNEEQSIITTKYYYDRMIRMNPMYSVIKKLGGNQKWPKRKSSVLKTP